MEKTQTGKPQPRLSRAEFNAQYDAAIKREAEDRAAGLRAKAAWYDATSGYIMMVTTTDRIFGVPVRAISYLKGLTPAQLGSVTLSPSGGGLHWDEFDIQIGVPGLLLEADLCCYPTCNCDTTEARPGA